MGELVIRQLIVVVVAILLSLAVDFRGNLQFRLDGGAFSIVQIFLFLAIFQKKYLL